MSFTCIGCGNSLPDIMKNEHHIHPTEYGGLNVPKNIVILCISCHQLIHYLAYQKAKSGNVEAVLVEYLTGIECHNINHHASVLLNYLTIVYNKYVLIKQGVIKSNKKEKKVQLSLPEEIKELVRIDGKSSGRGLEQHIQIILIRYLQQKMPGLKAIIDVELLNIINK